jgi:hypothetical protein
MIHWVEIAQQNNEEYHKLKARFVLRIKEKSVLFLPQLP